MREFEGFEPAAFDFLRTLGRERANWFQANKKEYMRLLVMPSKAFVLELGAELQKDVSDGIVFEAKTNGSIAPINNDLRFAPEKSAYKDHLLMKFWEGADKKNAPTLYVRISPSGVGFAAGAVFSDVSRWRDRIASESGGEFADALSSAIRATGADIVGKSLKRVPTPFPADHERGDLLRHKTFQVRWEEKVPAVIHRAGFVAWCSERLVRVGPIHNWLVGVLS